MFSHLSYVLLDAARMGEHMDIAKELNPKHDSLYRGGKEQTLFAVAPYIFQFSAPTQFSDWFTDKGWGDSWGVMLKSPWPLPEMHKHFRRFLMVNTEDGQQLYFRYYDPRVLRTFLPTCDAQQLREFFGPIDYFIVEDENPEYALRFKQENGLLKTERFKFQDIVQRHGEVGAVQKAVEEKQLQTALKSPPPAEASPEVMKKALKAAGLEEFPVAEQEQSSIKKEEPNPKQESTQKMEEPIVAPTEQAPKNKSKWNMFD